MISVLSGFGLIAASFAVIYPFIPRDGSNSSRKDWVDVVIVITSAGCLAMGVALVVTGVAGLFA